MANKPKSLLIIEDEEGLADLFKKAFEENNYQARVAYNGEEGLDKLTQSKPDVIILDLILPKMSGFELLKTIRSASSTYLTPVVIVTNLSGEENVKQGLDLGANEYIVKSHARVIDIVEKVNSMVNYQDRSN